MRLTRRLVVKSCFCILVSLSAGSAFGRVIPTAPVTRWPVIPGVQRRAARHAVVLELVSYGTACYGCVPSLARVAVHDSQGIETPRDATPGGSPGDLKAVAAWEGTDGILRLLLYGSVDPTGHASPSANVLYSADGGSIWSVVALPAGSQLNGPAFPWTDIGGVVANGISSPIRLGTQDVPFVGRWNSFPSART
jgi:hypothetical protein